MEYSEDKAQELKDKFSLSQNTIAIWKTRGKIPGKYLKDDFKPKQALDLKDKELQKTLLKILRSKKIKIDKFAELAEVKDYTIKDVMAERHDFSKQHILNLRKQLNKLRIEIKEVVEKCQQSEVISDRHTRDLRQILAKPELTLRHILNFGDTTEEEMAYRFKLGKQDIENELKKKIVERLAVFLLETAN